MMTPDLFARAGIALFGTDGWQRQLAKALQVNLRTIQRWASGSYDLPDGLAEDIIEILGNKRSVISEALRQIIAAQDGARSLSPSEPQPPLADPQTS